jgi:hypothetical protein
MLLAATEGVSGSLRLILSHRQPFREMLLLFQEGDYLLGEIMDNNNDPIDHRR